MSAESAVAHFLGCFEALRYRGPGDRFEAVGRAAMARTLRGFVAAGEPIRLLLPGFPHKNPSPDRSLGPLPDRAEAVSLQRLVDFCEAVTEGYCPPGWPTGCELTLFADGRVWGDLVGVPQADAEAYSAGIKAMVGDSPHIRWGSLEDCAPLVPDGEGGLMARIRAVWESPETLAHLSRLLLEPGPQTPAAEEVRALYPRMLGFLREHPVEGIAPTEEALRPHAVRMMQRFRMFSDALDRLYPGHLRLSVHARDNRGPKYAIRLFADSPDCRLPYHHVVLQEPDGRELPVRRAEVAGQPDIELVRTPSGQPWCFRRRETHRSE